MAANDSLEEDLALSQTIIPVDYEIENGIEIFTLSDTEEDFSTPQMSQIQKIPIKIEKEESESKDQEKDDADRKRKRDDEKEDKETKERYQKKTNRSDEMKKLKKNMEDLQAEMKKQEDVLRKLKEEERKDEEARLLKYEPENQAGRDYHNAVRLQQLARAAKEE